ncbi:hypothetical protein [Psychroflexus tropicus]|uniref:hypothetical protein n=1 Tax=Psychroflexus tropicus TaxID=197345 RepID=UPI0003754A5F|nr:hypothetical protein [Psychroflexus tropicus]
MELILPEPLIHIFIMSLVGINVIVSLHILVVHKKMMERVIFIPIIWILPILGIIAYYASAYVFIDEENRNLTS